jgi:hypothetical protein
LSEIKKKILTEKKYEVDSIQDYEMTATRRAKILLQTCAHASGAAYFYQKKDQNQNKQVVESQNKHTTVYSGIL